MQSGKMCWGRIKEGHPDCWFHCDADLRMAGCVRGTRVDSVCEDWLNKATDEAIVSVGTWCACLTGMWWLPVIGCHCGKLLARDITSCGVWHIMSHLIESWDCAVDRNIIRISRCCYISKLFFTADLTSLLVTSSNEHPADLNVSFVSSTILLLSLYYFEGRLNTSSCMWRYFTGCEVGLTSLRAYLNCVFIPGDTYRSFALLSCPGAERWRPAT